MFKLNGKIALITGSSKGLGAAMACCLSEAGANVILNYTSNNSFEKIKKVSEYIEKNGRKAFIIKANVS